MSTDISDFFNSEPEKRTDSADRPKPEEGSQLMMLHSYGPHKTRTKGMTMMAKFIMIKPVPGGIRAQGDVIEMMWFVTQSDEDQRRYERMRADDCVKGITGCGEAQCRANSQKLSDPAQPGRGVLVECVGERNKKKPQYLNYSWRPVQQTPENIAKQRAYADSIKLDTPPPAAQSSLPPSTTQLGAPPAAPPAAPPVADSGFKLPW